MKYLSGVTTIALDAGRCTGCGRCLEVCPHAVFGMRQMKAYITDRDLCMECGACMKNCAFGAIAVSNGVGCAQALINAMITGGEPSCDCSSDKSSCC